MAIIVVGGHSRDVGKTSVVAGLIAALPELDWTAVKITQFGHGVCSVNGASCDCATDEHTQAISEERSRAGDSDTSRFLVAGAQRSLWVRTKQGWLAEAMPALRARIAGAGNVIIESNSVMRFLRPDLYVSVVNFDQSDFKDSAREFLDRADAVLWQGKRDAPQWKSLSLKLLEGTPAFEIRPPEYVSKAFADWVHEQISGKRAG